MIPELSLVSKQEEKQDNLRLLSQSDNEELYFKAWEHLDENVKKRPEYGALAGQTYSAYP